MRDVPSSGFLVSQRGKLHYLDWGNPKAPPLLLIHGGRDHAHSWDWFARELRDDWHIIAPDLRGHGESTWSSEGNYLAMSFVYDLALLVDQLRLAPVTIVAHSMGGTIALRYAGLCPKQVRALVAVEGVGTQRLGGSDIDLWRDWMERRRRSEAFQPRRFAQITEAIQALSAANERLSYDQARHLTEHGVRRNGDGTLSWKYDPNIRVYLPFGRDIQVDRALWAEIACPTLMVWGRESWAENPVSGGYTSAFRDVYVLEIDGAAHWPHHDRFDLFTCEVRAFISDSRAGA